MGNSGRILIADDEELILLSTADLLRQEGYLVDCATDGAEAARKLLAEPYDVLVTDINMPGNRDLALLEGIPEPNRGLPVILMTGYPSAPTAIQAVNLSVLAYLVKPIDFQELAGHVRRGVNVRRIQVAAVESAQQIQVWAGEMAELAASFRVPAGSDGLPLSSLLGIMLGRMGETLLDMKRLVDLTSSGEGVCLVQNCPRLEMYQQIFREGIAILEKTKGAFKSRNLEDLRLKMENAMEHRKN
jgi:CheY-like chemotaxis protein